MPDGHVRKSVVFQEDMFQRMEDFRYENRISIESDAIRTLIEMGLHYDKLRKHPAFAEHEANIIDELNTTLAV